MASSGWKVGKQGRAPFCLSGEIGGKGCEGSVDGGTVLSVRTDPSSQVGSCLMANRCRQVPKLCQHSTAKEVQVVSALVKHDAWWNSN